MDIIGFFANISETIYYR